MPKVKVIDMYHLAGTNRPTPGKKERKSQEKVLILHTDSYDDVVSDV